MPSSSRPIEKGEFRSVLGHFASGVTVVAGVDAEGPVGLTCQSFFSLSIDPPLVALAPAESSTSWPRVQASGSFCINILAQEQ
jgi:3-hydroxy-9,10-secoandrosta-1,3,5(10)-triene-9,17-dione monooxygenase reductase component